MPEPLSNLHSGYEHADQALSVVRDSLISNQLRTLGKLVIVFSTYTGPTTLHTPVMQVKIKLTVGVFPGISWR
jgi:hypothetical protein